MDKNVEARLKGHVSFPSPPGVAQQIILLANDPEVQLATVAATLSKDPGLSAKVLRIANSALYARRRRSDNLRQALTVLGLGAATTLALSFSIAPLFRKESARGLDYGRCWRRALLSAIATRTLGERVGLKRGEDLFLAGLMQDIAVLALDRTKPDLYADLPANSSHADLCTRELSQIQADHAAVGAMLLTHWRMPEFLCSATSLSHHSDTTDRATELGLFTRCVGFGSELAEFFLMDHRQAFIPTLESRADLLLALNGQVLGEVISTIVELLPEIDQLFDTKLLEAGDVESLMDQARELLALKNLESMDRVTELEAKTDELEHRTETLQDQSRRDALTELYNRGHLESVLAAEFASAVNGRWPLSVMFIDLDHFKRVNDTYGHPAGDSVLRSTARVLLKLVRETDVVARYGGEEFVIVLPGLDVRPAHALCERIISALRKTSHDVAQQRITVTASLGLAVHNGDTPFNTVHDMVKAADEAVYLAKHAGRDRFICHARARDTQVKSA